MDDSSLHNKLKRLRSRLVEIVGEKGLVEESGALAPYLKDERGRFQARTPFVVRPASTVEVAAVVAACAEARVPIVPQGGNTGLSAGGIPFEAGQEIIVNLGRLNRIRALDPIDGSITVEAGCILQDVQEAAAKLDRLFPLSLGAEGSCQIGGNLSTNAGGIHVLRYGNMRDLVLGLEVVLPDGVIWDGLRALRKNNTGYDLKHLFIGAEGTLGIITAAVLKLFPLPKERVTLFIAVETLDVALELFSRFRASVGEWVNAFEILPRIGIDFCLKHVAGTQDPLTGRHPWYLLVELATGTKSPALKETAEALLAQSYEDGLVADATLAASEAQASAFWHLREGIVEAQKREGGSIKHDIAVPVSLVPAFIAAADEAIGRLIPGIRPVPFGHLGDGNIHYNLMQPEGANKADYLARWDEVTATVNDVVVRFGGSISAEHGLGRMKVSENERLKAPVEIALMRRIKSALDPDGLMNPGKVISSKN